MGDAERWTAFGQPLCLPWLSATDLFQLNADLLTDDAQQPAYARLFDVGHGQPVPGSQVACTRTTFLVARPALWQRVARNLLSLVGCRVFADQAYLDTVYSSWFSVPDQKSYFEVQFGGLPGGNYQCYSAAVTLHV